ncbi:SDR family oxidoreductase [Moheibacter sp. BDHS18]|uniref:SDR family oxidoreductase n=1 Tax=Moheibacter lacus TaxID=2745851 RepID=A0A838ZPY1_9FLAO|nr:SDR family oxidoreductase [Moheibacter lacus]
MSLIKNKYVIITGAASGLGKEFAKIYAKDGYALILADINSEMLDATANEIRSNYAVDVKVLVRDVSQVSFAQEVYDFTVENDLTVFGLVNNAGFGVFGNFSETNLNSELTMAGLHVTTPMALTKLFLKGMLERNEGEILNISSLAGFQPGPLMSIYYSTKAFLISFTEAIARENKGSNVRISVLCPGVVNTNFRKNVAADKEAKINSMNSEPGEVAAYGIRAMRKGKVVCLPSLSCQFLSILPRLIPRNTARNLIYKIQLKNRG